MTTNGPPRRDKRRCPKCAAIGILPLDQPHGENGEIEDPVMLCPVCETEFTATGMTWLGAFSCPDDWSDEGVDTWSRAVPKPDCSLPPPDPAEDA
jgi:hypothetical protein